MPLFSVYLTCTGYAGVPVVWGGLLLELYGRTNSHVQEDTQFAHTPTSSRGACQLIPAPSLRMRISPHRRAGEKTARVGGLGSRRICSSSLLVLLRLRLRLRIDVGRRALPPRFVPHVARAKWVLEAWNL